jgi:phospholipid/cholesterol/gamma-HCH transport system permease protein
MTAIAAAVPSSDLSVSVEGGRAVLAGKLDVTTVTDARHALATVPSGSKVSVELSGLTELDTAGSLLLCAWQTRGFTLEGLRADHRRLVDLIAGLDRTAPVVAARTRSWRDFFIDIGRAGITMLADSVEFIDFCGRAAASIGKLLLHPSGVRPSAIAHHITETGVKALPIVGLLAVMISIVLAYQGVAQLRSFGAQDLTINLVAVSVLRDMAVLITATLVAGRSGAAFAAEIGVMQAGEEVDAIKIMGLDPMQLLVAPRLIALVITLPLLTFFADFMGLAGNAVISQLLLNVSPAQYVQRVHEAVDNSDLFVGLVKAPVFAVFIALIGCMHGLKVTGSAESVGVETTRAVVKSIFLVIVLDALFSIFFEKLGI